MNVEKYFEFEDPDFYEDLKNNEDEFEDILLKTYAPTSNEILSAAENSGLSLKTIISHTKKKKPLNLLSRKNLFDDLKKMKIFSVRLFLNEYIEFYPKKVLQVLDSDLEKIMEKILKDFEDKKCEAADNYFSWHKICLNIKFLENSETGFEMFKSFSKLSDKYDENECKDLWEKSKPSFGSIGIILSTVYEKKTRSKENLLLGRKKMLKNKYGEKK